MKKTYKHRIITIEPRPLHEIKIELDKLGQFGWKLVSVVGDKYFFRLTIEENGKKISDS